MNELEKVFNTIEYFDKCTDRSIFYNEVDVGYGFSLRQNTMSSAFFHGRNSKATGYIGETNFSLQYGNGNYLMFQNKDENYDKRFSVFIKNDECEINFKGVSSTFHLKYPPTKDEIFNYNINEPFPVTYELFEVLQKYQHLIDKYIIKVNIPNDKLQRISCTI